MSSLRSERTHTPPMSRPQARPRLPLITPISRPRQRSVSPNEDLDYVTARRHWEGMPRLPLRHRTSNEEVNAAYQSWQEYIRRQEHSPLRPPVTSPSPLARALDDYFLHGVSHCGMCRNPHKYNHILWARGLISGYSCRCGKKEEARSESSWEEEPSKPKDKGKSKAVPPEEAREEYPLASTTSIREASPTATVIAEWHNTPSEVMTLVTFVQPQGITHARALVDSGATDCIISATFVAKLGLTPYCLTNPRQLSRLDGYLVPGGVQYGITLTVLTGRREVAFPFLVTNELDGHIILGYPWLREFEPRILWKTGRIDESALPIIITDAAPGITRSQALVPFPVRPPSSLSSFAVALPPDLPSTARGRRGYRPKKGGNVTVDPVTSPKAPQSGWQRKRESAGSATNSESRSNSRRKDSRASRRSPGHHAT